jgi:hypothetical protein
MWQNLKHFFSGNFKLSEFIKEHKNVLFPVHETITLDPAEAVEGIVNAEIREMHTIIVLSDPMSEDLTVALTIAEQVTPGAKAIVIIDCGNVADKDLLVTAPGISKTITMDALQTAIFELTYDGSDMYLTNLRLDPEAAPTAAVLTSKSIFVESAAGVVSVTVDKNKNVIDVTDTLASVDVTLNATMTNAPEGCDVFFKLQTNGTKKVIYGSGFDTGEFTFAASSKYYLHFVNSDGTLYLVGHSKIS